MIPLTGLCAWIDRGKVEALTGNIEAQECLQFVGNTNDFKFFEEW